MESITYKVDKIDGDYAHLINISNGEEMLIARALVFLTSIFSDTLEQVSVSKKQWIRF